MKRTLPDRPSSTGRGDCPAFSGNIDGSERHPAAIETGYVHLLKSHVLGDLSELLEQKPNVKKLVMSFLEEGTMPETTKGEQTLLEWFLFNGEPDIFLACLALAKTDSLLVNKKNSAETLLKAVQSKEFNSGINLAFECTHDSLFYGMFGAGPEEEDDESPDQELMNLLAATLKVNNGLKKVSIVFDSNYDEYLSTLLHELACIKNLEFTASNRSITLTQLGMFTELVLKNDQLKSFTLNLTQSEGSPGNIVAHNAAVDLLLKSMRSQHRLEHLVLHGLQNSAQEALGDLIANSKNLSHLEIALNTTEVTKSLLAGLRENTSMKSFKLKAEAIEDNLLPLVNLIKDNQFGVKEFKLETTSCRDDQNDFSLICEMIRSNVSISNFAWSLKFSAGIDFNSLGVALKDNRCLECLELKFKNRDEYLGRVEILLKDLQDIPKFTELLSNNLTLTKFFLSENTSFHNRGLIKFPGIDAILFRNTSYRDYACSPAFVCAAAGKFFSIFGFPDDVSRKIAEDLMERAPQIQAGSLALVNKTTYQAARSLRQSEGLDAVIKALAPGQAPDDEKFKMVELLRRVSVSQADFSDQTLCKVAASPWLDYALNTVARENPEAAERLKKCLMRAAVAEF